MRIWWVALSGAASVLQVTGGWLVLRSGHHQAPRTWGHIYNGSFWELQSPQARVGAILALLGTALGGVVSTGSLL